MIVLDASVLLAAEDAGDVHHGAATRLLEVGAPLATVELAVYETTNVAIRRWGDRDAARRLRDRIFAIADLGELVRVDRELAELAESIAVEHEISVYDACYAAGARRPGATLASCDVKDLVDTGLAQLPGDLAV